MTEFKYSFNFKYYGKKLINRIKLPLNEKLNKGIPFIIYSGIIIFFFLTIIAEIILLI